MKDFHQFLESICLILVLYKTKLQDSESFQTVKANLLNSSNTKVDLIVYDNSPESNYPETDRFGMFNIHYIHDSSNPGISKAYNEGARIAESLNKKWLLLLDQDTSFPPEALERYYDNIIKNPSIHLFAPILKSGDTIFSPCRYILKRGFPLRKVQPGPYKLNNVYPVNSGLLIRLKVFMKTGGYNEKIKLDFSDFAFLKEFKKVDSSYVVLPLICKHGASPFEETTLNQALLRFGYYCEGAKFSSVHFGDRLIHSIMIFLRVLKLSNDYKSIKFVKVYWEKFIS